MWGFSAEWDALWPLIFAVAGGAAMGGLLLWLTLRRRPGRASAQQQSAYQKLLNQHHLLAESEARFRALIDTTTEGIWMLDTGGIITFANDAMHELLRCPGDLVGRSVMEFVFDEERAFAEGRFALRLAGDRERLEFSWRAADGMRVHTLVSMSALRGPNGIVTGLIGMVSDISDRVAMNAQLQRLNLELGQRVEARTRELEESNRELAREIVVREYVQSELVASNERLNLYLAESQRHTGDITRLNELGDQLHSCDSRREMIQVLQGGCRDLLGATGGALFDARGEALQLLEFGWGDSAGLEGSFRFDHCRAAQTRKVFPVNHQEEDGPGCEHRQSLQRELCIPLLSRGQFVGLLTLQRPQPFWSGQPALDRRLEQLIRALAEHAALALDNLSLRETLREQSLTDPLTGLFNRRYLNEQMSRESARWERDGRAFALVMIDIDHFKHFNDRYGHDAGDAVLIAVAELMREQTRRSDLACRLGGEEFVLLMVGVDDTQALGRAETLREAVRTLALDGIADPVSISCGVALYPKHGCDGQALLRAADDALYASKRGGRNRSTVAQPAVGAD
jgi:diguanylate cyclase (GGDEF)-like protein/PAS domain S-box-containing protein